MTRRAVIVGAGTLGFAAFAFVLLRGVADAPTATAPAPYQAPALGDANAPVTIVEYGDFQCPSCGAFFRSVEPQLVTRYVNTGKVKLVFKHFPWIGPESQRAAEASACAYAQGRFWEYRDLLYRQQHAENSGFLSADRLKQFASDLSLDRAAFEHCLDGGAFRAAVQADLDEVRRLGLNATPTLIVNGERVIGGQSFSVLQAVVERKLHGA